MGSRASGIRMIVAALIWTGVTGGAFAQDKPDAEQLRKMYDSALETLKAAQDSKNALATENDKLNVRVTDLEKQLQASRRELAERDRETFFLRSYYAAWQRFMERYPNLKLRWDVFLKAPPLGQPSELPDVSDPNWPLSAAGE